MAERAQGPRTSTGRHRVFNRVKKAVQRQIQRRLHLRHRGDLLSPEDFDPASVRKALIILPNWKMGNLLLATPIAEWLRRGLTPRGAADPVVDLCSGGDYAALLDGNPHVRRHIAIPSALHPAARRRLLRDLTAERYDLAYLANYRGTPLGSRIALATGARWRVGAGKSNAGPINLLIERPGKDDPITDQHRVVLERLGLAPDPAVDLTMVSSPGELEEARREIAGWNLGAGREPLGLFVVGHRIKQISIERWARIIERLRDDFPELEPVVFAGPSDGAKVRRLQRALGNGPVRVVTASLRRLCALVECTAAVVSCDAGPLHLARAKRRPIVSLFTKDNFDKFAPRGPGRLCLHRPHPGPTPEEVSAALRLVLGK